jgi:hypothetical protein
LVLSPSKITFFARNAAVPAPRTALAKSSAADKPGVSGVTATTSASWLDAVVEGNKITVSVRPGQVWQGKCRGTVSVTAPGLEGSPGLIQVMLDADETFPAAPIPAVPLDAGVVDADGTIIDANGSLLDAPMVSIDASSGLAQDVPPCDTFAPSIDAGPTIDVTPPSKQGGSGCSCSFARSTERSGAFLLLSLALLLRRPSRAARKLNRSR